MLQENCRIEKFNGYRFYEQDIFFDDYMFSSDIQLTVDLDYVTPGFGIALVDNEGYSIKEKRFAYLFKVGYKEASIYYATKESNTLVKQISTKESYTIQEKMKFTFIKQGKKITIKLNGNTILSEYTNKSIDKYNIGYYSNAGNIINSISIASAVPNGWTVNMNNTQGGYIKFYDNSIELRDCLRNAEIEQSKIRLTKGTYYLKFDTEKVNGVCDIKHYIHKSNDDRMFDDEKNLLTKNGSFTLLKDTEVNLKFTGKQGIVKKIILSDDKDDTFIPTTTTSYVFDGSYLDVYLSGVSKVKWTGVIMRTPDLLSNEIFGMILDAKTVVTPQEAGLAFNKEYDFEFSKDNYMFSVFQNGREVYALKLKNINNRITIFKDITATISSLILVKTTGEEVTVNLQDESIKSVNANIAGPILVVDKYNDPLDLSSSYRVCHYDDYYKYVFTNHEREIFDSQKRLVLENKILNADDTVRIFGIPKTATYDISKIYDVVEDNINSIDLMTDEYDMLFESDVVLVDKVKNTIYLSQEQVEKYEIIIVDYLKSNSYCVNYHYNKHTYEVNISSIEESNKIVYDSKTIEAGDKTVTQVHDYKITEINGNTNGYVVIRKGAN